MYVIYDLLQMLPNKFNLIFKGIYKFQNEDNVNLGKKSHLTTIVM